MKIYDKEITNSIINIVDSLRDPASWVCTYYDINAVRYYVCAGLCDCIEEKEIRIHILNNDYLGDVFLCIRPDGNIIMRNSVGEITDAFCIHYGLLKYIDFRIRYRRAFNYLYNNKQMYKSDIEAKKLKDIFDNM